MMYIMPLSELAAASDKMLCALDRQTLEITATEFARLQQGIFACFTGSRLQDLTAEEKIYLRKIHRSLDEMAEHIKKKRDEVGTQIKILHTGKKMKRSYSL